MPQNLGDAVRQFHAGDLEGADRICRGVIAMPGKHAEALHLSAAIALRQGELGKAEQDVRRAIEENPAAGNYYNTLGVVLRSQGNAEKARDCYVQVLELSPGDADAAFNLANVLCDLGETAEAIRYYQQACARKPDYLSAYLNLGHLYRRLGALEAAEGCFRQGLGQIGLNPQLLFGLGLARLDQGHHQDALGLMQQVVQYWPQHSEAHFYAGNALHALGRVSSAEEEHRICVSLKPDYPMAWNNLGNELRDQGRLDEAREAYRKALQLKPDYMRAHSNLLLALLYDMPDAQAVYEAHLAWDKAHASSLMPAVQAGRHDFDAERKLRIAYVSPDFREHSVAYFIEPILAAHDRGCFEVYCLSDVVRPDVVTERLKGYAGTWLDISACSDEAVANRIREERIDILVDLTGHTSRHRLMVFARKPAPIQVTYLGYPATSGMRAMDYRLSDAWADPEGQGRYHSEKLLRLPAGFLCYAPSAAAPRVAPSPYTKNGYISFGCFNHLSKVTPEVIEVWSHILQRLPDSHLVLKHVSLQDAGVRERYLRMFEGHGVGRERIDMLTWSASVAEHLGCYSRVDIALDTFPYNGTTTSCEALWMGVPVVCLEGKAHAGRVGLSLLESAGRREWVAGNRQEYASLALQLAADPEHLAELRQGLRQQLTSSSLCDRRATTHALEAAYRSMWQACCERNA